MSSNKKYNKKKPNAVLIDADFRIKIEKAIEDFVHSSNMVYEFPSSLTNVERAFVHNMAPKYNLKTKSTGFDEKRRLSLFKLTENNDFLKRSVKITLDPSSLETLKRFRQECPSSEKFKVDLETYTKKSRKPLILSKSPCVPPPSSADSRIQSKRKTLPIYESREHILKTIEENRVLIIQAATGSGKTTQIPQYILEEANEKNRPCRILCTQPRRISAIASAERVSYERSEPTGGTLGYQIRLESSISQDTNCIFLTPGVFVRYLMTDRPDKLFQNITHILIDEAHERNKENDFLLTSIKEHFNDNPNLKLIIMSATMNTSVFSNYFGACEEISIETKQYDVEEIYLEDILKGIGFRNKRVEELNDQYEKGQLVAGCQSAYVMETNETSIELDEQTVSFLNEIFESLSTQDNAESEFDQFIYLVQNESIPVDFRHATTKMTALMIAVGRSYLSVAETLLKLNANMDLKVVFGGSEINCLDISKQINGEDSEMTQLLIRYLDLKKVKPTSTSDVYNKALINIYYDTILKKSNNFVVEEGIDHDLICQLIEMIHNRTDTDGAILVFLPGHDDIIQLSNMIKDRLRHGFTLFLLHSSMKTEDQKNVFKPTMHGDRKIILSTNIAESSITIDDVIYVIDSGREKQKSYDALSHSSSLRVQWISKASANQRRGRAGRVRNGYVYRVYSSERFSSMLETTIPEILRTSLTEICLQTKLMIKDTMKIEEFLKKCISSPSIASIRQSIKFLQCLGALDQDEGLTLLGSHLAQMPVDAKYAKMLIYGVALNCLNPVLSIVSILSMGDQIFVLPVRPADRYRCHEIRRSLGAESSSDHFVMLNIFQQWMSLKKNNINDRKFCEENFLSSSALEHVRGIRNQIMSYLQSSGIAKADQDFLNRNSLKWPVIKACLCAGLYPNVARINRKKKAMYSDIDRKLVFHMSSTMCNKNDRSMDFVKNLPADWVVYEEKNLVGKTPMIRCNTLINSFSLSLSAGASLNTEAVYDDEEDDDDDQEAESGNQLMFKIDNLVTFLTEKETGSLILILREKLDELILRFLSNRNFMFEANDDNLIRTIVGVIETEERHSGFEDINVDTKPTKQKKPESFGTWRNPTGGNGMDDRPQQYQNQRQSQNQNHRQSGSNGMDERPQQYQNQRQSQNQYQRQSQYQNQFPNQRQPQYQNHQNQQYQAPRHQQSQTPRPKLSNTFFSNNAGYSENFSTQAQNPQSSQTREHQSFFVMKMESEQIINEWAKRIVFDIGELKLQSRFMNKMYKAAVSQSFIFFYSTSRSEFMGFGDIMPRLNKQDAIQFHFRMAKKIPLESVRRDASCENLRIFQNSSDQMENITYAAGVALLKIMRS